MKNTKYSILERDMISRFHEIRRQLIYLEEAIEQLEIEFADEKHAEEVIEYIIENEQ